MPYQSERLHACITSPMRVVALAALLSLPVAGHAKAQADDEIVVRLRDQNAISSLMVTHQLSLVAQLPQRPIYRLKVVGRAKVKDKIKALQADPAVIFAEENATFEGIKPGKNVAWAIGNAQSPASEWAGQAIQLEDAHRLSKGTGVRVAVLDTGVDLRHPAFAGRLLTGYDFVEGDTDASEKGSAVSDPYFGHGTHVAGVIAAVAPGARIMPLRVIDSDGLGSAWGLAQAMLYAADPDGNPNTDDGAHVINLSLSTLSKTDLFKVVSKLVSCNHPELENGGKGKGAGKGAGKGGGKGGGTGNALGNNGNGNGSATRMDADTSKVYITLGDRARCSGFGGAVVVAAAGNSHSDKHEFPAAEDSASLLSVGASNRQFGLAKFSNFGPWVKIAAPGEGITSAIPGGGYATWSGTSMAAPYATGAVALMRAVDSLSTADQLVAHLRATARKLCDSDLRHLDIEAALINRVDTTVEPAGKGAGKGGGKGGGKGKGAGCGLPE
jgi:subtilisin family serine protease